MKNMVLFSICAIMSVSYFKGGIMETKQYEISAYLRTIDEIYYRIQELQIDRYELYAFHRLLVGEIEFKDNHIYAPDILERVFGNITTHLQMLEAATNDLDEVVRTTMNQICVQNGGHKIFEEKQSI